MSRKHVTRAYKMIDAGDISGNVTSSITNVEQLDNATILLEWTGTSPVGTINIEARQSEAGNWIALDFGGTVGTDIPISGNSGNHIITLNQLLFHSIRVTYTSTSGTGSMDATLKMKTVGA